MHIVTTYKLIMHINAYLIMYIVNNISLIHISYQKYKKIDAN